jgi:pantoate--beta-alanine ligase
MGNLHEGHLSLVRQARALARRWWPASSSTGCSSLPHEDFDRYPRTLERDCTSCSARPAATSCSRPTSTSSTRSRRSTSVQPPAGLADILEGEFRPGFFNGVCTVVLKLFNLRAAGAGGVRQEGLPAAQGDARHGAASSRCRSEIVGRRTVRAADGLALSSRNGYLSAAERAEAPWRCAQALREAGRARARPAPPTAAALEQRGQRTLARSAAGRPTT